tara:strand:- start:1434 stop:1886 length:453 start_codon:yes stop_codon:yes gene_type:complete
MQFVAINTLTSYMKDTMSGTKNKKKKKKTMLDYITGGQTKPNTITIFLIFFIKHLIFYLGTIYFILFTANAYSNGTINAINTTPQEFTNLIKMYVLDDFNLPYIACSIILYRITYLYLKFIITSFHYTLQITINIILIIAIILYFIPEKK